MLRTLGIALLCLAALAPSRVEAEAPTVIVAQGDALSMIAKRAGVSVDQIKEWNQLDGDLIRVGQKLVVGPSAKVKPSTGTRAPKARPELKSGADDGIDWAPPFDYQSGCATGFRRGSEEHAPRVAARDPSTAVATRAYDKPVETKKRARTYRVQSGDTLTGIALKHGTTQRPSCSQPTLDSKPTGSTPGRPSTSGLPSRRSCSGWSAETRCWQQPTATM